MQDKQRYADWLAAEKASKTQARVVSECIHSGEPLTDEQVEKLGRLHAEAHTLYLEMGAAYRKRGADLAQLVEHQVTKPVAAPISLDKHWAAAWLRCGNDDLFNA